MPKPRQRESVPSIDSSPPSGGLDRRLSKSRRLGASTLFKETYAQGRRQVGRRMVLWIRTGPDASLRLGTVTGKKVSLRANRRNRLRRRLREAFRRIRPYLEGEVDVVLVGRRGGLDASWEELVGELLRLAVRSGLLSEANRRRAERDLFGEREGGEE